MTTDVAIFRRMNYNSLKKVHDGEFNALDYLALESIAREVHSYGRPIPKNFKVLAMEQLKYTMKYCSKCKMVTQHYNKFCLSCL